MATRDCVRLDCGLGGRVSDVSFQPNRSALATFRIASAQHVTLLFAGDPNCVLEARSIYVFPRARRRANGASFEARDLLGTERHMDIKSRERRALLGWGGSTFLAWAAPEPLSGCGTSLKAANASWTEPVGARAAKDPRLFALNYALLAPSSHNTQPWFVDLSHANRIHVYCDPSRRLPHADPLNRQLQARRRDSSLVSF